MQGFDWIASFCLGLGLAAACGLRIFMPLLVLSAASIWGNVPLAPSFAWVGTYPALATFGIATLIEIAAYYVPWIDHALDTIMTPASLAAGSLVMATNLPEMSPVIKWGLAIITGGGLAGIVQGSTVLLRGASTMTTGGIGNPLVATGEWIGSLFLSILSIVLPIVAVVFALIFTWVLVRWYKRRKARMSAAAIVA